jgi:hypothetical protein
MSCRQLTDYFPRHFANIPGKRRMAGSSRIAEGFSKYVLARTERANPVRADDCRQVPISQ